MLRMLRMRRISLALLLLVGFSMTAVQPVSADVLRSPAPPRAPDNKRPADDKDQAPSQNPNDCAVAKASARYVGYGYTHVISLVNGCSRPVECALWTDVDPDARQTVSLRAGDTTEVVTRRGSPAREVTAFKQCSFR